MVQDPVIRLAIEIAGALVLSDHDRDMAKLSAAEGAAFAFGGVSRETPQVEWDTVEKF